MSKELDAEVVEEQNITGMISVVFTDDGEVAFEINTENDGQLLVAMLGIEGYFARRTGLGSEEIREILDGEKPNMKVRSK